MRSSLALIATTGLVAVALSGCASAPAPEADSGQSSDTVEVSGAFGQAPRVDFPTPLNPDETQCDEVIEGDGEFLTDGQLVLAGLAVYDGASGELLQELGFSDDQPQGYVVGGSQTPLALSKGLSCGREGSRVVVVAPPEELSADPSQVPEGTPSLVIVADIQQAFPARAEGAVRLTRDGFPAVVLAPDGRPGITVPKADPFETTQVELLKEGNGQVVESGDQVVVHYTGVTWADNEVFDSTWESGNPAVVTVATGEGSQVVPGFAEAVIGQKVGSQVVVVVAPSDGYGDQASEKIAANSTLVFVIDILGVI